MARTRVNLKEGATINEAQQRTIEGAFLSQNVDCDVWPDSDGCVTVVPHGEEAWTGHVMDAEGDYLFPTVAVDGDGVHNVPGVTKCKWDEV